VLDHGLTTGARPLLQTKEAITFLIGKPAVFLDALVVGRCDFQPFLGEKRELARRASSQLWPSHRGGLGTQSVLHRSPKPVRDSDDLHHLSHVVHADNVRAEEHGGGHGGGAAPEPFARGDIAKRGPKK
jgi:hypothetical protein